MAKFSTPFFTLLSSWKTVKIYGLAEVEVLPVWRSDWLSDSWSSYLDGAFKNFSSNVSADLLNITVQAKDSTNAWMGLTTRVPNCSDSTYLQIRYKIDIPSNVLEVVSYDSKGHYLKIWYLPQSQGWHEETFELTEEEAAKLAELGLIIWTRDTLVHRLEVDYILLLKVVSAS
jgi:hypothetical protein